MFKQIDVFEILIRCFSRCHNSEHVSTLFGNFSDHFRKIIIKSDKSRALTMGNKILRMYLNYFGSCRTESACL